MTSARAKALLAGTVVATATGVGGLVLGTHTAEKANWHIVTLDLAQVVGEGNQRLVSIRDDGWTYGIEDSVPRWIDSSGSTRQLLPEPSLPKPTRQKPR